MDRDRQSNGDLREPLLGRSKPTSSSNNEDTSPIDEETGLASGGGTTTPTANDSNNNDEAFHDEPEPEETERESSWLLHQKYRKATFLIACMDLIFTMAMAHALDGNKAFGEWRTFRFPHATADIVWITVVRTVILMIQCARYKSVLAAKIAAYIALFGFLYVVTKLCSSTTTVLHDTERSRHALYALLLVGNLMWTLVECVYENLVASFNAEDMSTTVAPTRNEAAEGLVTGEAQSIGLWELLKVLKPYFWPTGTLNRLCVFLTWFFLLLSKAANILAPLFIARATDDLANHMSTARVTWHIVCYASLVFLNKALKEAQAMAYIRVKLIAGVQLKEQLFSHILSLSMDWHQRKSTGAVVTAVQRGITASNMVVQYIFLYLFPTAGEAIVVAIVFVETFGAPQLAAVAIVGCTLYVVITIELTVWRMQFRKKMNKADNDASHKMTDSLLNIEIVKCFSAEQHELERYRESVEVFQDQAYRIQGSLSLLNSSQQLVLNATLIAALLVAAHEYTHGRFSLGQFVAVNVYVIQLFAPLNFLGSIYGMAVGSYVDLENLCNIMAELPDIQDRDGAHNLTMELSTPTAATTSSSTTTPSSDLVLSPNTALVEPASTTTASSMRALDIEFRDVTFAYPSRPQVQVLQNVSFKVSAGTTTALVGETGSGKSSLTKLLFRFYEVSEGQVLVAGQNVLDLKQHSLRRILGMVPQDHSLFNDTLRYNIAYGRLADQAGSAGDEDDDTALDEAIQKAATAAELDSFVSQWPDGYQTVVGERGQQLSGGQKQRIAIARVLLKDAPVVVLDEATSSLDSRTEEKIQSALEALKGRTMIIIAHRLSTIQNADQIIVMANGKVLESGTHKALLSKGTWHERCYASLWEKQKKED